MVYLLGIFRNTFLANVNVNVTYTIPDIMLFCHYVSTPQKAS